MPTFERDGYELFQFQVEQLFDDDGIAIYRVSLSDDLVEWWEGDTPYDAIAGACEELTERWIETQKSEDDNA